MSDQRIIYTTPEGGVAVVVPTGELPIEQVLVKDVPAGAQAEIVSVTDIPSDRTFRNAWIKNGKAIGHDLAKAKGTAHDKRRAARTKEFTPLDVEATIPAKANQAEAAREAIRQKYATMQTQMDAAATVEDLKALLPQE
jgi:hypothetical protein